MITGRDSEFLNLIAVLYREELGREPDSGGLAGWLRWCQQGDAVGPEDARTGERLRQLIHDSPEGVAYRARPVPPPVPHLEVRGNDFVDATGARIVLNGTDQFCAYDRFLRGASLDALFDESRELRFTLWRVLLMGSMAQNRILDLRPDRGGFFEGLRPFADLLNAHGIILLATVFADAQDVMPSRGDRQQHWLHVTEALGGSITLASAGNQFPKNGWSPDDVSGPPYGMLWSRGSSTEDQKVDPRGASFAEFHPRRDLPASLLDSVASPVTLYREGLTTPLIISEPIGFAEEEQPGRRSSDPVLAWKLARHYATECGGAVFHSDAGMRGQVMGPVTRACAEQWSKGMVI